MKKFYIFAMALLCAVIANAATIAGGTKLYLQPNSNWLVDGARFALYVYGSNGDGWSSMTLVAGETGIYEGTVPEGTWSNVIFTRMNGSAAENNWDNKWNQTDNLVYDGVNNMYSVTEGTWDKGGGTWSTYGTSAGEGTGLFLVGNEISNWGHTAGYQFQATETENIYTLENVKVCGFFKIADKNWNPVNIGSADENKLIKIGEATTLVNDGNSKNLYTDGTYTASITLDMTGTAPVVTITGEKAASGVYLKGDMNNWGDNDEYQFTSLGAGVYELEKTLYTNAGTFKITANDKWYRGDAVYGTAFDLVDGGDNMSLPEGTVANKFTLNLNEDGSAKLTITQGSVIEGLFLRGNVNNWEALDEYKFTETETEGVYELKNIRLQGFFKIADALWAEYNIGSSDGSKLKIGQANYVVNGEESKNFSLSDTYMCSVITIDLSGDTPVLTITGEATGSGIFVNADANEWGASDDAADYEFTDYGAGYYYLEKELQDSQFLINVNGTSYGAASDDAAEIVFDETVTLTASNAVKMSLPEGTAAASFEVSITDSGEVILLVSEGEYIEDEGDGGDEGNESSAIEAVQAEGNSTAEYYNLQGVKVSADKLTNGVYIRKQGNKATKVIL